MSIRTFLSKRLSAAGRAGCSNKNIRASGYINSTTIYRITNTPRLFAIEEHCWRSLCQFSTVGRSRTDTATINCVGVPLTHSRAPIDYDIRTAFHCWRRWMMTKCSEPMSANLAAGKTMPPLSF